MEERYLYGRKIITTDTDDINAGNVVAELQKAMNSHNINSNEIDYLWRYYKGEQPIVSRKKEIRPEINNRIVENRANEITTFKVSHSFGKPVQYVNRGCDDKVSEDINKLNEFVFAEGKAAKDKELAEWFTICGTAYRMCLPKEHFNDPDESPFEIYTLDPRYCFVVRHSGLGNKPVMGVKYVKLENNDVLYSVYTASKYFEIRNERIEKEEPHILNRIPIIEYPANSARLGAFEIALPILNAINRVASNRLDAVEQFVQAILVLKGVDMEDKEFIALNELGGLKLPIDGDAKYLVQELNQTQTQTLVDYMYDTVLTICGMPNRNGGSSTSDTGAAVILRDGWSEAEARAQDVETMFKASEREFLKLAIRIANDLAELNLRASAVEIKFTRRNYENIQGKAQVLNTMLSTDKIHPRLAFEHCGMFADPENAYIVSEEYFREHEQDAQKSNPAQHGGDSSTEPSTKK